jgi:outer membrane receptor for ferrienterochelin and colicins
VYNAPPVIPSLNAKFMLNDKLDFRLAYGYGFRAPSLRELYFYFFDASHSIKGNPDLKAEYSNSFSGSLAWQSYPSSRLHVSSTIGIFYNAFENLVTIGVDAQAPSINTYINVYKYRTAGVTLSNMVSWKALKVGIGFSYIGVYNQLAEEDESLPRLIYTPEVNTTLAYAFATTGTALSLFYKFTGKRSSYQTTTVDNEEIVILATRASYHWVDITATQKLNRYLNLNAGVRNLSDITNFQNTSQDTCVHSDGGPVPLSYGRSYFVGLNFKM